MEKEPIKAGSPTQMFSIDLTLADERIFRVAIQLRYNELSDESRNTQILTDQRFIIHFIKRLHICLSYQWLSSTDGDQASQPAIELCTDQNI
jgi:hypothetical protein